MRIIENSASASGGGFAQSAALTISDPDASRQQIDAAWRAVDEAEFFPQVVAALSGVTVTQKTASLAFADSTDALALASSETMRDYMNVSDYLRDLMSSDQAIWEYVFVDPREVYVRWSSNPEELFYSWHVDNHRLDIDELCFSEDGEYFAAFENTTGVVGTYKTRRPFEVCYATPYGGTQTVATNLRSMVFFEDGHTFIFVDGQNYNYGFQHNLASAYDFSATFSNNTGTLSLTNFNNFISFAAPSIGLLVDNNDNPTLFTVSGALPTSTFYQDVETAVTANAGAVMSRDGKQVLISASSGNGFRRMALTKPFEIDGGQSTSSNFFTNTHASYADNGMVSEDGSKVMLHSGGNFQLYEMTTPNDFLTMKFAKGSKNNMSVYSATSSGWEDVIMKPDGTRMFGVQSSTNLLHQWDLDIDGNPHNASSEVTVAPGSISGTIASIDFKPDGTEVYIADTGNRLLTYTLSTAWDISSMNTTPADTSSALSGLTSGVMWSEDGAVLLAEQNGTMYRYGVTTPYRLSTRNTTTTANYQTALSWEGVSFSRNGKFVLIISDNDQTIRVAKLNTAYDISSSSFEYVDTGPARFAQGGWTQAPAHVSDDYDIAYTTSTSELYSVKLHKKVYAP